MYSVTINNESFTVEKTGDGFSVNGAPVHWDIEKIDERTFHIIRNKASHLVEILKVDPLKKTLTLKLDSKVSEIFIKDRFDLLLEKLGMNLPVETLIMDIKAPMPGLIVDIKVKIGDAIKKGDPLLVLEAMKMENVIKASSDCEVKKINVEIGTSVEKNQILIQF